MKDKLHPELRKTFSRLPPIPFHSPLFLGLANLFGRLGAKRTKSTSDVSVERKILGEAAVWIYRPQGTSTGAGLVWIHGGGYIMGSPAISDERCKALVRELGAVIVSVDYRLAPKHPYPYPLDDCYAAWEFLQDRADELGVDRQRVAVGGESAGGGLAAALVQRIADAGGVQPVAQLLLYPMLDDRTAADTALDAHGHLLWSNKSNRYGWRSYLGHAPGAEGVHSLAAPARREDLSALPATWIGVGDLDLFFAEDCEYAERLKEAGVSCELVVTPGAPHGFDLVKEASVTRGVVDSYTEFLRRHLARQ